MGSIKVLDKHTANRIAAGEVVERPASVVKELVENSVDAGAKNITIETAGGGLTSIRVTDDGSGIARDDTATAFLRHATSKIADGDDLDRIGTLGFRGEALASVAAVARVTLTTKTRETETGSYISIDAGTVLESGEAGAPDGTTVEVRDLFYNVPARLKFVKAPHAEAAYISDYVSRMIMARPDISFRLIQSDKTVYHSAGDGELKNAIYCVYGASILNDLRELRYDDGKLALSGFIGTERIGRANRTAQSVYINGRYIRSQKLSFALSRAYETRLMTGKFPFAVIDIAIPLDEVDVNVHPNKLDVRFRHEEDVMRAVVIASRKALTSEVFNNGTNASANAGIPSHDVSGACAPYESNAAPRETHAASAIPSAHHEAEDSRLCMSALAKEAFMARPSEKPLVLRDSVTEAVRAPQVQPLMPPPVDAGNFYEKLAEPPAVEAGNAIQTALDVSDMKLIGLAFDCYWIVQQEDSLFFIDQHAAHERALYERILKSGVNSEAQLLLIPEVVKLSPLEYETLFDNKASFIELGFEIDDFGPLTVSIRAVPSIMGQAEAEAFLREAIALLDRKNKLTTIDMKRAALIRSACRHAVKAGERINEFEIRSLLEQYAREGIPMTCPHGRPVMVRMSKLEFEKLFKRVL